MSFFIYVFDERGATCIFFICFVRVFVGLVSFYSFCELFGYFSNVNSVTFLLTVAQIEKVNLEFGSANFTPEHI
jgi:hypothetical protein